MLIHDNFPILLQLPQDLPALREVEGAGGDLDVDSAAGGAGVCWEGRGDGGAGADGCHGGDIEIAK